MFRQVPFLLCVFLSQCLFAQTSRNALEEMTERLEPPEPLPFGPALMQQVRDNLPPMPLRLSGEIRTRSGKDRSVRSLISELYFGEAIPRVTFSLADAFGSPLAEVQVQWEEGEPVWLHRGESIPPPRNLVETGLQGADLALEFLWWPGAEVTGVRRIRARDAYEVLIPDPAGPGSVRLRVDKRALFVVEAETLDAEGEILRRLEVDRLKKIREELWMVQDLVVRDYENKRTINIRFFEVEELQR